jgi:AmpE protein
VAVTIILICLAIQRWLQIDYIQRKESWFNSYYQWIKARFNHQSRWATWLGVVIIIAPLLIIYILFAVLVCHLLTIVGYYMLALVVMLYALDARPLTLENANQFTSQQLLINAYQRLFALIFWLLLLGSTGVVLYTLIVYLCRLLETMPEDSQADSLLANALKIQAVLDWLPLRLLGFTFALVGEFSATFLLWYKNLFTGLSVGREQTATCGLTAIGLATNAAETPTQQQVTVIEGLINRSLWVWLVIIALFTIGRWVG